MALMKRFFPRQTLKISLDPTLVDRHEATLDMGGGEIWRQSSADEIREFTYKVEVDGMPVLTLEHIRGFTIENPHLFPEIEKRLTLLENILFAADTGGTVVVVREGPGEYSVLPHGSYTLMSAGDDDDRD